MTTSRTWILSVWLLLACSDDESGSTDAAADARSGDSAPDSMSCVAAGGSCAAGNTSRRRSKMLRS